MTIATPTNVACEHTDSRLEHIPGVPAELFVDPSQEHWFWVRKFRWLFAPAPGKANKFARWYARSTVVPLTNVTNLSLQYQSYLNDIFHTTKFARIGHALAMPGIVICLSALFRMLGGDWFALPFHVGLTLWWLLWGLLSEMSCGALLLRSQACTTRRMEDTVAQGDTKWQPGTGLHWHWRRDNFANR